MGANSSAAAAASSWVLVSSKRRKERNGDNAPEAVLAVLRVMATTSLLFGESVGMTGGFNEGLGKLSYVGWKEVVVSS